MIIRKMSIVFMVALLAVLVRPSYAENQSKGNLSDQEAELHATMIFEEKISAEDTQKLRSSLSKADIDKIISRLEKK